MHSQIGTQARLALALFILCVPVQLEADVLQGEFSWSGTIFDFNGPDLPPQSGTATFVYDTVANEGTISGLPDVNDLGLDTSYSFSTYYNLTNSSNGDSHLLPASTFSDLTSYQNLVVNGEPATTFWIISPQAGGGSLDNDVIPSLSGGYLNQGTLFLSQPTLGLSGDDSPVQFEGTFDDLIQTVPEPGTTSLFFLACIGLVILRCQVLRNQPRTSRHPPVVSY